MTNETKKRGIGKTLFIALVALTLISCCFLGSTFARYTSNGTGAGSVTVAKWDIDDNNMSADSAVNFGKLSPSKEVYTDAGTPRTNSTGKVLIATITNSGDVGAKITFTFDTTVNNVTIYGYGEGGEAETENPLNDFGSYEKSKIVGLFTAKLYYGTETGADKATTEITSGTEIGTALASEGTFYIYADITWTTADSGSDGTAGDALDTWVGQNVSSISWPISYVAVQASEQPTA